jgi:peptidoglycan hydrolase-like protein with peptidoglycan-binding domain
MSRPHPARRPARRLLAGVAAALATALGVSLAGAAPAQAANVATPGNFTGYGFDQCVAPSQSAMDAWLRSSPFWAVGIYISGDSRACTSQPNLTPAWISTQLRNGWRLLPITLGPQAWCTTRDRYLKQVRINPDPATSYRKARAQGRREAVKAADRAGQLGLAQGSTLWYDLEAFDTAPTHCRESALSFLSAWTNKMHGLGYVSGVYSSAASGMKILDDARVNRPGKYAMPDQIWVADWNGSADVHSTYIRRDGWMPHARVHQYRGDHRETHGGVTIDIDSNWLDVGRGTVSKPSVKVCGGVKIDFADYPMRRVGSSGDLVKAAQCLLKGGGWYSGAVDGKFDAATGTAVAAFRKSVGQPARGLMTRGAWTALVVRGNGDPLMKYGAGSRAVRRVQRALNAADVAKLTPNGIFEARTTAAVKRYQADHGLPATGVVTAPVWNRLRAGIR